MKNINFFQVFTRFVEVGRAVVITKGPDAGKLAVIVEIVDHNRAIVDCPATGVKRQVLSFKRMRLTDLVIALPRACRSVIVSKCVAKAGLVEKFQATSDFQKIEAAKKKATLNDFERFQVAQLKKQMSSIVKYAVKSL